MDYQINSTGDKAFRNLMNNLPKLLGQNIPFMIITFLAFYVSEVIKVAKELKEEQSLTI